MGYITTDFILDRARGRLLREADFRPGLEIRIGNGCSLVPAVARVAHLLETNNGRA